MDYKNTIWNNKTYQEFLKELEKETDEKNANFLKRIINDNTLNIIGLKTPKLKKIAKEISRGDYKSFIKTNKHKTYEEIMIHGLILGYIKENEETLFELINNFIKYISNWAVCDTTCANLKQFKNIDINKVNKFLKSQNPWTNRVGLVLLNDHYIKEENLKYIFSITENSKKDHYYIQMAVAWLISTCYIKYPKKTLKYLKNNTLDKFTFNKTISKICDSYRVKKEDKDNLKKLKI